MAVKEKNCLLQCVDENGDTILVYPVTTKENVDGADLIRTPVKGVDYWTEADQESIVQQVITALGTPVFGSVDEHNNIILTGELAAGTYTIKYEDADGNVTTIGTLTAEGEPTYTNVLTTAINADGTAYVGDNGEDGYNTGYRIKSTGEEVAQDGVYVTGYIPATVEDKFYLYDIAFTADDTHYTIIALYDENFAFLGRASGKNMYLEKDNEQPTSEGISFDENGTLLTFTPFAIRYWLGKDVVNKTAYVRIAALSITTDSIITINEPIG